MKRAWLILLVLCLNAYSIAPSEGCEKELWEAYLGAKDQHQVLKIDSLSWGIDDTLRGEILELATAIIASTLRAYPSVPLSPDALATFMNSDVATSRLQKFLETPTLEEQLLVQVTGKNGTTGASLGQMITLHLVRPSPSEIGLKLTCPADPGGGTRGVFPGVMMLLHATSDLPAEFRKGMQVKFTLGGAAQDPMGVDEMFERYGQLELKLFDPPSP